MIQRGEPASYLSLVIVAVVFGVTIFLTIAAGEVTITGATVNVASSATVCGGNTGVCYTLGIIVMCAITIAIIEFGRGRKN